MAERTRPPWVALAGYALTGVGGALLLQTLAGGVVAGIVCLVAGLALIAGGRVLPRGLRVSPPAIAGIGLALTVGVIVHGALTAAPFDIRRILLAMLGIAMQVLAPFLDRPVPVRQPGITVGSLATPALALVGTPLLVWALLFGFAA